MPGSSEPLPQSESFHATRSRHASRSRDRLGPLRILLLEGGAADAALMSSELRRAGLVVIIERVASADALSRAVADFVPDVIVADRVLPQLNPVVALEMLRAMRSAAPVIVVADAQDIAGVVAACKAGAEDVILKSNLSGLGAAVAAAVALRRPLRGLSPRQREVLGLMADGRSTRGIAELLGISIKTAEAHRSQLMRRLGIRHVAGLTRYALRVGLVARDPQDPVARWGRYGEPPVHRASITRRSAGFAGFDR